MMDRSLAAERDPDKDPHETHMRPFKLYSEYDRMIHELAGGAPRQGLGRQPLNFFKINRREK